MNDEEFYNMFIVDKTAVDEILKLIVFDIGINLADRTSPIVKPELKDQPMQQVAPMFHDMIMTANEKIIEMLRIYIKAGADYASAKVLGK